ncbi:MAG: heavy metal resistance protein CzcN [Hyphomicrobium sp.]|nr:MAG: heavy metal resistance protein CzcN [Hyphomicrobium sp.]PPD01552.1 MAG: heavy metal resistance protein CzcN [Hyphomicrobium sp.]
MLISDSLIAIGSTAAIGLIAALLAARSRPSWQIWPAPPQGSVKSFLLWTLFRTLNASVFALAMITLASKSYDDRMPLWQASLLIASAILGIVYVSSLIALGRKATYCQASGLETGGIYQWTRNPQYTTAIAAIGLLAAGVGTLPMLALATALITVYVLMAMAEEPWLLQRYGQSYIDYAAEVPRFFSLGHVIRVLRPHIDNVVSQAKQ